jgi:hypothetical protein
MWILHIYLSGTVLVHCYITLLAYDVACAVQHLFAYLNNTYPPTPRVLGTRLLGHGENNGKREMKPGKKLYRKGGKIKEDRWGADKINERVE